jgi:hypothetical protein
MYLQQENRSAHLNFRVACFSIVLPLTGVLRAAYNEIEWHLRGLSLRSKLISDLKSNDGVFALDDDFFLIGKRHK